MIVYVNCPLAAPPLGAVEGAVDGAVDGAADAAALGAFDGALDAAGVDEHAPNTMAAMAMNAMPRTRILVPPPMADGCPYPPTGPYPRLARSVATEIPDFKYRDGDAPG